MNWRIEGLKIWRFSITYLYIKLHSWGDNCVHILASNLEWILIGYLGLSLSLIGYKFQIIWHYGNDELEVILIPLNLCKFLLINQQILTIITLFKLNFIEKLSLLLYYSRYYLLASILINWTFSIRNLKLCWNPIPWTLCFRYKRHTLYFV